MTVPSEVDRLLRVLAAEEALYVQMHAALQKERTCMVELDVAGLEEAVRSKELLAEEARLLEEGRVEVARALATALALPDARPTLSRLCEALGSGGDELSEAHSRLSAIVGSVRELLDLNAVFAGECLGQVQATLSLLGRLAPTDATYGPAGPAEQQARGRLVRQSA